LREDSVEHKTGIIVPIKPINSVIGVLDPVMVEPSALEFRDKDGCPLVGVSERSDLLFHLFQLVDDC
jgi:hypothetical protein